MVLNYFQNSFNVFLIIFARVFGLFLTMPIIGTSSPVFLRAGLAMFVALVSLPMILSLNLIPISADLSLLAVQILLSLLVGAVIGFCMQIIITSFQAASDIFSNTMGLSISESIDPVSATPLTAIGSVMSSLIALLFIRTESHITLIEVVVNSFREINIPNQLSLDVMLMALVGASVTLFGLALQIAMPLLGLTILLDLAMGLMGRVAPQFNVMILGWNIKILLGFVLLWLLLPHLMDIGNNLLWNAQQAIWDLVVMAGGQDAIN